MTSPHNLSYATASGGTCPLCQTRPVWKKSVYGHPVCKKCNYKFVNRRQVAYLIDGLLSLCVTLPLGFAVGAIAVAGGTSWTEWQLEAATFAVGLFGGLLFVMKDGFAGYSPGKWLTNLRVLNDETNEPIGFGRSFGRNAILLVGQIPVVGGFAALGVVIIIAMKLGKGYRLGDRWAGTRVIWMRYANNHVFAGDRDVCPSCGYSTEGNVSGICPECGTPVPVAAETPVLAGA